MKKEEKELEYLLGKIEVLTQRYIEAETFIMELKWYERLFCSRKVLKFLKSRSNEYEF